jgi:hypothetical protein
MEASTLLAPSLELPDRLSLVVLIVTLEIELNEQ